jgi:hypothetical protein
MAHDTIANRDFFQNPPRARIDYEQMFRDEFPTVKITYFGGRFTRGGSMRGGNVMINDHDTFSRDRKNWKYWFERWHYPYGMWTCQDGREVLFNRQYKPIWQRINGTVTQADLKEFVHWTKQGWFFDDSRKNIHTPAGQRGLDAVLTAFKAGKPVTTPL